MSIQSWYNENYPIDAELVSDEGEAIEHSIRKWKGFLPENLAKHGVKIDTLDQVEGTLIDENSKGAWDYAITPLNLDSGSSCALCEMFFRPLPSDIPCAKCPIVKSGQLYCFNTKSAYMLSYPDKPELMIEALEVALRWYNSSITGTIQPSNEDTA
mgnify:CR=1 FL=1